MSIVRIKRKQGSDGPGTRSALTLACLLALAGLFTAASAMGGQTHPFQSAFTGSGTPDGSLSTADKVAVRQSTGNVYVIDKGHGVVDTFDGSGTYVSQVGTFGFGADPDLAVDNSGTASEGNLIRAAGVRAGLRVRPVGNAALPAGRLDHSGRLLRRRVRHRGRLRRERLCRQLRQPDDLQVRLVGGVPRRPSTSPSPRATWPSIPTARST